MGLEGLGEAKVVNGGNLLSCVQASFINDIHAVQNYAIRAACFQQAQLWAQLCAEYLGI